MFGVVAELIITIQGARVPLIPVAVAAVEVEVAMAVAAVAVAAVVPEVAEAALAEETPDRVPDPYCLLAEDRAAVVVVPATLIT